MKLTLFTTCKPFDGLDGVHQRNALRSWQQLEPTPEILVIGDDAGTADVCASMGLRHVPGVQMTPFGKPDVADVFRLAHEHATGDVLAYVNADIILYRDFIDAVTGLHWRLPKWLMIGQRHNLDVDKPLTSFLSMRNRALAKGDLLQPTGTDYFAFPRHLLHDLTPHLGVGHLAWDNYIPWLAVTRDHAALVNATPAVVAVHQNHPAPDYNGHPGAERNHAVVRHADPEHPGDYCGLFLADCSHWLTPDGLKPKVSIVLPSYRRADRLIQAVLRIYETTPDPYELIVVIDEDTASRDALLSLNEAHTTVLFNEVRKGAPACWNQGLAAARGEVLAFWNDDCMPEPGWCEAALAAHQAHLAGYGLCGFNDGYQDGNVLAVQYLFDRAFCVDHLGGVMAYPVYEFAWNDTETNARAKNAGRFYWCRESVVQHNHWSRDGGQMDDLNRENMAMQGRDGYIYYAREKQGFPNDFEPVIRY